MLSCPASGSVALIGLPLSIIALQMAMSQSGHDRAAGQTYVIGAVIGLILLPVVSAET
jgi:uncharacterized membrane protein